MIRAAMIDLSLTGTGIAHVVHPATVNRSPAVSLVKLGMKGSTSLPLLQRRQALETFAFQVCEAVTCGGVFGNPDVPGFTGPPTHVGIETPALSKARGGVFERGHVWYGVVGELQERGIVVVEVGPTQIKQYATGTGSASKGAVIDAIARRVPVFETRGDEDLADAAAGAALLADLLGEPLAKMPAQHRKALDLLRKQVG